VGGNQPPDDVHAQLGDDTGRLLPATADPKPWYLNPWVLALWGLTVVALIAVIVYGLVVLAIGGGGGAPSTSTQPSPTTTTTTTTPTTTTTTMTPTGIPTRTTFAPPITNPLPAETPRHHWWDDYLPNIRIPGL